MFRSYEMTLHRVHDSVRIKEGAESLMLYVDADPMRMTAGLSQAQKLLQGITEESAEEAKRKAVAYYAAVIFGKEQAERLFDFYHGDADCVVNVCGQYFVNRLSKLIVKAQKKTK